MRKLFLFFVAFLLFAPVGYAKNYSKMCPVYNKELKKSKFSHVATFTGYNLLLTSIVENRLESALKKSFNSDFKLDIKPIGVVNFSHPRFSYAEFNARNVNKGVLNVSNFRAQSICNYNEFYINDDNYDFINDLLFNFSVEVTSNDLQKTVLSPKYMKVLDILTVKIGNRVVFKVLTPDVYVKNNKIHFLFNIITPIAFVDELSNVELVAGLSVNDNKIVFSDLDISSSNSRIDLVKILPILNIINPLSYEFNLSNKAEARAVLDSLKITDDKINIDGVFIIPKNCDIK